MVVDDFLYICFYVLYLIFSLRFFIHTGVLAFPIPGPVAYPRLRNNKRILIQYPVRNEPKEIIERFFKSLWSIPEGERHRFKLQVLDDYDSVMSWRFESPIETEYLKRQKRVGNKAGNLNYGLLHAGGYFKYAAIFDSDHEIDGKGLVEAVEILEANPNICCVQSRWVFSNPKESLLSVLQEHVMGVHIEREQTWRSRFDVYPIFNGAGGVWNLDIVKKECGGWLERCVCEDTDISGVMNMLGYKIHVLPTWETKVELVETWSGFRKQQNRWIKGNGQQFVYHLLDPRGWSWKKAYWLSWNLGFFVSFTKYIFPCVVFYKYINDIPFNFIDHVGVLPHVFAWYGSAQTWDNKFCPQRLITYLFQFIIEFLVLDKQIEGFWHGLIYWDFHHDFVVTPKGSPTPGIISPEPEMENERV